MAPDRYQLREGFVRRNTSSAKSKLIVFVSPVLEVYRLYSSPLLDTLSEPLTLISIVSLARHCSTVNILYIHWQRLRCHALICNGGESEEPYRRVFAIPRRKTRGLGNKSGCESGVTSRRG